MLSSQWFRRALHGQHNQVDDELRGLGKFQRNNLPTFMGRYDPKCAHTWLKEIEKFFRVMTRTEEQKVLFGTHMLSEEVEDWWDNTRQRLEITGTEITWTVFRVQVLKKYFPENMHSKKKIEFLKLKTYVKTRK